MGHEYILSFFLKRGLIIFLKGHKMHPFGTIFNISDTLTLENISVHVTVWLFEQFLDQNLRI